MRVKVIGGGFAGCEAAYQLAKRGADVTLCDMKPQKKSPAHNLDTLCEVVCSNSFKSADLCTSSGLLKKEMEMLDSLVLRVAKQCAVPAGNALAVDRYKFSQTVTEELLKFPNVDFVSQVADNLSCEGYDCVIVATGPLTDESLIPSFREMFGNEFLYFFDAVAPIVTAESIDMQSAFIASRYGKGDADYLNCPMNKQEYLQFYSQLVSAETVELREFENNVFEGCMPIEVMAKRGEDTMRFGPLKPVGLYDIRTKEKPYAVLQLRKENAQGTLYNLVGFQTNLKFGEQKRVFSLIPALKNAEFVRFGVMHRNTYINAPKFLNRNFQLKTNPRLFFAGQLTGVEGYMESTVSGLVAGLQAYRIFNGLDPLDFSLETLTGALCNHVSTEFGTYSPMNSNFGILSPLQEHVKKCDRKAKYAERAIEKMKSILAKL
ncbi:MAG: methylenetetrahydrofolate--tRNA-(uracil(54)-C(5))-methyltransferase (FADH(2)-oxidizing) TrmFO [Corallococcus sp.]|nr:methylenetetrahydrofolate--tRNA-(uracil(54)-C(5))-methyltransferase (FADH(2)-oxidizing) TrmFO [Corallococcus sp.]MCM1359480.1 methylenetetrahydrofolate--tRNA-(uracil(54)-C(5))-methyltransferase (FADH(2)-oxidizing) TrmFO [Corallococcus sp.]MCM1394708.1 methylenetetrahydrofolate--tRNA-(uracil(54)-C(5))-methyltransferase (FADH(2)-oxidizing) TrmFO [Corallococcus sp.]